MSRLICDLQDVRDNSDDLSQTGQVDLPSIATAVLDCMTEGVSVISADGRIVYTNAAEDRMFGYGRGELTGRHVSVRTAWPEAENQRRHQEVLHHLSRHGSWHGEWLKPSQGRQHVLLVFAHHRG